MSDLILTSENFCGWPKSYFKRFRNYSEWSGKNPWWLLYVKSTYCESFINITGTFPYSSEKGRWTIYLIDQLEILQSTKVLGIILEQHLGFVMHINSIVQKLNFLLMMLQYLWKFVNKKCMIDIYYSFIYPHLIYGVEFAGHAPDY